VGNAPWILVTLLSYYPESAWKDHGYRDFRDAKEQLGIRSFEFDEIAEDKLKPINSTVFPGNSELPFIYVQRGQSITLFPVVEASKLIALQSLLTLLEHVQLRAALKCLVQDQGDAVANLREGERRGPFFSPERFLAPGTM